MNSCGISASALSGMRYGVPKFVAAVADQLFLDDREDIMNKFFAYSEVEFVGEWPKKD